MLKQIVIKIRTFFLTVIALIPVLFVCCFLIQQQIIRHEMKEKLEQQSLHTITATAKDFHWMEEGKEIMVDGKMFDIHSYSQKNGTYFFTGLFDEEETSLVQQLEKTTDRTHDNKTLIRFFQLLQSGFYSTQQNNICIIKLTSQQILTNKPSFPTVFICIPTPPPRS